MTAAVVIIVVGGGVLVSGVLGLLGRLPRNRLVGVRTGATMQSDQAFAIGNRAAGPATALGGLAAVAGGVVGLILPRGDTAACVLAGALLMGLLAVVRRHPWQPRGGAPDLTGCRLDDRFHTDRMKIDGNESGQAEAWAGLPQTGHSALTPMGEIEQASKIAAGFRQPRHGWRRAVVLIGLVIIAVGVVAVVAAGFLGAAQH